MNACAYGVGTSSGRLPLSALTYPAGTRFSLRDGATCLVTAAGGILLNPPRNEKLTGLTGQQRRALKTLNSGPATLAELVADADSDDIEALVTRLLNGGWLSVSVRDEGRELYAIEGFGVPGPQAAGAAPATLHLSKFSVLHRDTRGYVLENPLGWCDIRIQDLRLLPLLDGPGQTDAGVPEELVARFLADLRWGGFLVTDSSDESHEFSSISWSAPDLWFHRRSTLGERTVTWDHFGPTKWAKGKFPQPAARRRDYPGSPVSLPAPDLAALRAGDPTLTTVIEDRISVRAFDDADPITVEQLSELLYRTARTRAISSPDDGEELLSRPYPSGGSVYELELYPVVRHVAGLAAGMYHYDSFEHVLRPVADADSVAVKQLLKTTSATLEGGAEPQVLLVMAARAGRVMWTYEQVAYSAILKHVGVLMQTIYLAATAMGLGACAQGFGDTAAFTAAAAVPELQECSVGSMVLGTPAAS
ncbi:SagB family peptide dehydrogenase [Mycobacteroides abscessus]|uniref:Nitroreductase domain-containing protein n=2 Tax=Mycobacteroides abscessus TaxID=36809 RepID=B1MPF5_MYCA9|nr:SagB family peptide dehydrogenase [Mycobacteroides abscessus]EUA60659.1 sagB-type dehydrogenase domain protein [Mycobacteroides abscessus 1948]AKP58026.1 dehydrogenase [Mycobacteroides abscessus UC22]ALM16454.1 dehydrogenase [Mycobacteroides abscessus]AMU45646.1 dehydrogenase [Mycobacteroides abscessus]AMU50530.1 dehydrogenase [Mycobacteroides abscessus]